jgi:hypothetical protein
MVRGSGRNQCQPVWFQMLYLLCIELAMLTAAEGRKEIGEKRVRPRQTQTNGGAGGEGGGGRGTTRMRLSSGCRGVAMGG